MLLGESRAVGFVLLVVTPLGYRLWVGGSPQVPCVLSCVFLSSSVFFFFSVFPAMQGPRPVVLSGPSGAGKSTLIKKLFKDYENIFGFSVSREYPVRVWGRGFQDR